MSKRIDELSQNLASGMSRRRALQIFAGGLVAAAFGRSAIGAQAASQGKIISDFCKTICTPFFTGAGNRGLQGNYYINAEFEGYLDNYTSNYYANYSSYDVCMANCRPCADTTPNPCGSDICVQAEFPGQPVAVYCLFT